MSFLVKEMKSNKASWNYRHKVDDEIKRYEEERGITLDRDEVLDFLFGNFRDRAGAELDIYLLSPPDKTVVHRLNHLWAFPLMFILWPFRYVLYGDAGWTNKTKMGRFLLKCCGFDED